MTHSPLVTIGLPVYNSEKYLEQSIKSLLAQTFSDFVLIISDNASIDGTPAICQKYADADSRVKYYRNDENIGNPRNFNRVFELCKTRYLKWSTADDYWEPSFLYSALKVMEDDPEIILCYPKTYLVDAGGDNPRPYEDNLHLVQANPADRFLTLLERISLSHQHLGLMRTSLVRRTHMLGAHVASDINFLAEMTLYGKFYELPERLFYRRFHETSGSWKRNMEHQANFYLAASERNPGFTKWNCHIGFIVAVSASPLPLQSKMRIHRRLMRRMIWDRTDLINEPLEYASDILRRRPSK